MIILLIVFNSLLSDHENCLKIAFVVKANSNFDRKTICNFTPRLKILRSTNIRLGWKCALEKHSSLFCQSFNNKEKRVNILRLDIKLTSLFTSLKSKLVWLIWIHIIERASLLKVCHSRRYFEYNNKKPMRQYL